MESPLVETQRTVLAGPPQRASMRHRRIVIGIFAAALVILVGIFGLTHRGSASGGLGLPAADTLIAPTADTVIATARSDMPTPTPLATRSVPTATPAPVPTDAPPTLVPPVAPQTQGVAPVIQQPAPVRAAPASQGGGAPGNGHGNGKGKGKDNKGD